MPLPDFSPGTLFITQSEVISLAIPDISFDEALIKDTVIQECQYEHLFDALDKDFYYELEQQIRAETISANTANNKLYTEYLKPAIAFFVKSKIAPDVAYKLTNAGVMNNSTEYSQPVNKATVEYIRSQAIASGESWRQRALIYLRDNITEFPTYKAGCRNDEKVSALSVGIIINRRKRP